MSILRKLTLFSTFIIALSASAQMTTISTTGVIDSDSTTWANGTWSIQFRPSPSNPNVNVYNLGGAPLSSAILYQKGGLDGSGTFTATIYDSSRISPSGSGWTLQICPLATSACGNYIFSSAGSTEDLTAAINSIIDAPRFNALAGAYGYVDVEAHLTIPQGGTYWSNNNNCQRYFNLLTSTWVCAAGGSNLISGTLTPGFIPIATAPQGLGNSTIDLVSGEYQVSNNWNIFQTGIATSTVNASSNDLIIQSSGWNTGLFLTVNNFGTGFTLGQIYTATISGETCTVSPSAIAIGNQFGQLNVNLSNPGSGCTVPGIITVTGSPGSGWVGTLTIANGPQPDRWIALSQYVGSAPFQVALNLFAPGHKSSSNLYEFCFNNQMAQGIGSVHCINYDGQPGGQLNESMTQITAPRIATWPNASGVVLEVISIVAASNCGSLSGSTGCYQVNDGTGVHFIPKF